MSDINFQRVQVADLKPGDIFIGESIPFKVTTVEPDPEHFQWITLHAVALPPYRITDPFCFPYHKDKTILVVSSNEKKPNLEYKDLIYWWSHSVCNFDLVSLDPFRTRICNSWGDPGQATVDIDKVGPIKSSPPLKEKDAVRMLEEEQGVMKRIDIIFKDRSPELCLELKEHVRKAYKVYNEGKTDFEIAFEDLQSQMKEALKVEEAVEAPKDEPKQETWRDRQPLL